MSKRKKIDKARSDFLNCKGSFLEKCKLAEIYLNTVSQHGSMDTILETKKWKQNRTKKLKDCCETCGSTEGLHISHTWHPPRGKEMKEHVHKKYGQDVCPICDSNAKPTYLKTQQKYRCYAKKQEFKPHIHQNIRTWERIKDMDGVREKAYKKFGVDTDEKVIGSIQGYSYDTSKFINPPSKNYKWETQRYWQNRHTVKCGAIFDKPSKRITKSTDVYRYYYALEHISFSERYIEMREGDILTECKKCGFERDQKRILEKKQ